nr:RNA helicase [Hyphomonadaceae bacterium]
IEVARPAQAAGTITQRVVPCVSGDPGTKRASLRAVIEQCFDTIKNAIIFCNRKTDVDIVAKSLAKHGFDAAPIHGDLQQSQRTATLDRFRSGELKILVASDVAARGLDIPDVSHVLNYDVPRNADDYVHRIGRTGRAGRLGEAFMLVSPEDRKNLAAVEALIKTKIEIADIAGLPTEKVAEGRGGRGERSRRPDGSRDPRTSRDGAPARGERPEQSERAEPSGRAGRGSRPRRGEAGSGEPESAGVSVLDVIVPEARPDIAGSNGLDGRQRESREPRRSRHPSQRGRDSGAPTGGSYRDEPRDRSRRRERDDDGPPVLAFGDSMPAFMLPRSK